MTDLELVERLLCRVSRRRARLGARVAAEGRRPAHQHPHRDRLDAVHGDVDGSLVVGRGATRVASQIVTGIGFLGAGAIMRTGAASKD